MPGPQRKDKFSKGPARPAKIDINKKKPEFNDYKFINVNELMSVVTHFKKEFYSKVIKHFKEKGYL